MVEHKHGNTPRKICVNFCVDFFIRQKKNKKSTHFSHIFSHILSHTGPENSHTRIHALFKHGCVPIAYNACKSLIDTYCSHTLPSFLHAHTYRICDYSNSAISMCVRLVDMQTSMCELGYEIAREKPKNKNGFHRKIHT